MEQYWMPKRLDCVNLRKCLNDYEPENIFIRLVGSCGGTVKVDENIKKGELDFKKGKDGLYMLVKDKEVFHFPLKDYTKGFSIGYGRFRENGSIICLSTGIDPDDPNLPEPRSSLFRTVLDNHLMEISFKGKIPLKFHSWWQKPHWKYWTIA